MWSHDSAVAISIGLAVVAHHTGGRHICIVPNEESRSEYMEAMRKSGHPADVIVGRPKEVMGGLEGVDLAVVDCRRNDFDRLLRAARLGQRGAILICKNVAAADFRWRSVLCVGEGW
ncbi:hypothetical protein ACS0TY_005574 [Phlomoides rotata]